MRFGRRPVVPTKSAAQVWSVVIQRGHGGRCNHSIYFFNPAQISRKYSRWDVAATAMRNGRSDLKDATVEITNAFLIAISNSFSSVPDRCSQTPYFNMALTVDISLIESILFLVLPLHIVGPN